MISLLTRIQHPDLYARMKESAQRTAHGSVEFLSEQDQVGLPMLAATYNRLGVQARGDILAFAHDDVVFMQDGWDTALRLAFAESGAAVLGAVGTASYEGGRLFASGWPHGRGKYVTRHDGQMVVKVYSAQHGTEKAEAVDAFFMAVPADHFHGHKFDETFDELWFYDLDYCLSAKKVAVADILLGHHKPEGLYGRYPEAMKDISAYWHVFHAKHGLRTPEKQGDQRCAVVPLDRFASEHQAEYVAEFNARYMEGVSA